MQLRQSINRNNHVRARGKDARVQSDSVVCNDLVDDSVFIIDLINVYFMYFILPA